MSARRQASAIELNVFGVPALLVQGRKTRLALKRAIALLAYLAFNDGPVPRSHLATMLWPDASEPEGRTRLRRLIYTIEEAVGHAILSSESDCLELIAQTVEVDALRFAGFARKAVATVEFDEHLVAEARQWMIRARRPLMQGIAFGSEVFDDWLKAAAIEHEHLLARLLERTIDALDGQHAVPTALELVEALIALDLYREPSYVRLMQLHARQGHRAGVEAAYARCAELLRAEFGIKPGPQTERAYQEMTADLEQLRSTRIERPGVRFAETGLGTVAYTTLGVAERTLVICPGFVCHIEIALEHPPLRAFVEALADRFRVILFDRRGVGLSERLRATGTPASMGADIDAILNHAGLPRAWLFGSLARGSAAPDYPWALPAPAYDVWLQRLVAQWGGPAGIETFAPTEEHDPAVRAWWARLLRHAASPGGLETILAGLRDSDLRADLCRISAPTLVMHRRGDRAVRFEAGEHLARNIPGAVWRPLEGVDHFWWCGDSDAVLRAILEFAAR